MHSMLSIRSQPVVQSSSTFQFTFIPCLFTKTHQTKHSFRTHTHSIQRPIQSTSFSFSTTRYYPISYRLPFQTIHYQSLQPQSPPNTQTTINRILKINLLFILQICITLLLSLFTSILALKHVKLYPNKYIIPSTLISIAILIILSVYNGIQFIKTSFNSFNNRNNTEKSDNISVLSRIEVDRIVESKENKIEKLLDDVKRLEVQLEVKKKSEVKWKNEVESVKEELMESESARDVLIYEADELREQLEMKERKEMQMQLEFERVLKELKLEKNEKQNRIQVETELKSELESIKEQNIMLISRVHDRVDQENQKKTQNNPEMRREIEKDDEVQLEVNRNSSEKAREDVAFVLEDGLELDEQNISNDSVLNADRRIEENSVEMKVRDEIESDVSSSSSVVEELMEESRELIARIDQRGSNGFRASQNTLLYQNAIDLLQTAYSIDPQNTNVLFQYGNTLVNRSKLVSNPNTNAYLIHAQQLYTEIHSISHHFLYTLYKNLTTECVNGFFFCLD